MYICVCVYAYTGIYLQLCSCIHADTYTRVYIHACIHAYLLAYMYIHMCEYIICMYTYTLRTADVCHELRG